MYLCKLSCQHETCCDKSHQTRSSCPVKQQPPQSARVSPANLHPRPPKKQQQHAYLATHWTPPQTSFLINTKLQVCGLLFHLPHHTPPHLHHIHDLCWLFGTRPGHCEQLAKSHQVTQQLAWVELQLVGCGIGDVLRMCILGTAIGQKQIQAKPLPGERSGTPQHMASHDGRAHSVHRQHVHAPPHTYRSGSALFGCLRVTRRSQSAVQRKARVQDRQNKQLHVWSGQASKQASKQGKQARRTFANRGSGSLPQSKVLVL